MPEPKRILFLYTELANYTIVCVQELVKQSGAEVHIIRWPVNNEAPFDFNLTGNNIHLYNRHDYQAATLSQLVNKINPHLIYCSGWVDKGYVKICRTWKKKIPVIAGIDTKWTGSLKQKIHAIISPVTVRRSFTHLWVAGKPQETYAKKLGFPAAKVLKGVYAADVPYFSELYRRFKNEKENHLPKRFIFVGRYLQFKGIFDLWEAFIQTCNETNHDWELWCLGTGDDWEKRVQHPRIKHIGFVQPADIHLYIKDTGVFILPSHFEPWAVAVHEFAAAGFPLICSNQVGAASQFLEPGNNGFIFEAGNVQQLKNAMLQCIQMDPKQLVVMGDKSHQLAQTLTPASWAASLLGLL